MIPLKSCLRTLSLYTTSIVQKIIYLLKCLLTLFIAFQSAIWVKICFEDDSLVKQDLIVITGRSIYYRDYFIWLNTLKRKSFQ